jgi:hypothetical protein
VMLYLYSPICIHECTETNLALPSTRHEISSFLQGNWNVNWKKALNMFPDSIFHFFIFVFLSIFFFFAFHFLLLPTSKFFSLLFTNA